MANGLTEAPGIGRLLSEHNFTVPNHQRDYSWTEDEVNELLEDITTAIDTNNPAYFVGLMVFLGSDLNLVVLDGQQRLATAVIIFSAIRNWLNQYDEYRQDADDIQRDFIGRRKLGGAMIEPKLIMNIANQQLFTDYIVHYRPLADVETAVSALRRRDKNRVLLDASIQARRWVGEKAEALGERATAAQYFFDFVNYMRDNVGAVKLVVPNEEMAYTIFETLNDRGLELSPLDLVKNHLFARAASHSQARVRLMETRWMQMMQTLANVRSDQFLKVFWTSRHGRIRTRNLFETFKRQYPDTKSVNDLSMDMLAAAEQYAALETADDPVWAPHSNAARSLVRVLKVIGSQQAHPVMLAALARFDAPQMERLLRLLEVCIVRYLHIGGGNTGRFETTCAILARKIYAGEITTATAAHVELSSVYPNDPEFRQAFLTKEEENNQKAQYFLRKLEVESQRVASGDMPGELEPGTLTVEHILPRNPGAEWAEITARDPDVIEDCVFRLGNLCLLTEVNRRLARDSFSEKIKTYSENCTNNYQGNRRSNRMGKTADRNAPSENGIACDRCLAVPMILGSDQLKQTVERMHGGTATLTQSVPVRETFEGKPVWEGVVHVFDLAGHPTATRAYAFVIEDDVRKRIAAVLHQPPVDSPQAAVRAAIVAESRGQH